MARALLFAPILCLLGCIHGADDELAAARASALAPPPALTSTWAPDAALHLSPELTDRLVKIGVARNRSLGEPFEIDSGVARATITPALVVDRVKLAATDRCEGCLAVNGLLSGTIAWESKLLNGSSPVEIAFGLDVAVAANVMDGSIVITSTPHELRSLVVRTGSNKNKLPDYLQQRITEKLKERMDAMAEPVEINRIQAPHVRAARVIPSAGGVGIALRTDAPSPTPLPSLSPKLTGGWQVDMSEASVVAMAAREAFQAGPVAGGLIVEPKRLDVGRERFTLTIRVWKVEGTTLWRDYQVQGALKVSDDGVQLAAEALQALGTSDGAAVLAPLASLAESLVFDQVRDSLQLAVPKTGEARSTGLQSTVRLTQILGGQPGVLAVHGDLDVVERARPTGRVTGARPPAPLRIQR